MGGAQVVVLCVGVVMASRLTVAERGGVIGVTGFGEGSDGEDDPMFTTTETHEKMVDRRQREIEDDPTIPVNRTGLYNNQHAMFKLHDHLYYNQHVQNTVNNQHLIGQPLVSDNATDPVKQLQYHKATADHYRKHIAMDAVQLQMHGDSIRWLQDHIARPPQHVPANATALPDKVLDFHKNRVKYHRNQSAYHVAIRDMHEEEKNWHYLQHDLYYNKRNRTWVPVTPTPFLLQINMDYKKELLFHGLQVEFHSKKVSFHATKSRLNRDWGDAHEYQIYQLQNQRTPVDHANLTADYEDHHVLCHDTIEYHKKHMDYLNNRTTSHKEQYVIHGAQLALQLVYTTTTMDPELAAKLEREATTKYYTHTNYPSLEDGSI